MPVEVESMMNLTKLTGMIFDNLTTASMLDMNSNYLLATAADSLSVETLTKVHDNLKIVQIDPTTTVVAFIVGIIPFIWATWRFGHVLLGASFGTGSDSVVILAPFEENGDDLNTSCEADPLSSRARRSFDRGALTVANILFAVVGGLVAIAIANVLMGSQAPPQNNFQE